MSELPLAEEHEPGSPRRQRRPQGENRERLIRAGMQEFSRRGYRGASTTVIAQAAEVPQPHVYANFSTKQQLFVSCLERAIELINVEWETLEPNENARNRAEDAALTRRYDIGHGGETQLRDACAALLYQAVAALGDDSIASEIRELLVPLHTEHSELLDKLLCRGAHLLLQTH